MVDAIHYCHKEKLIHRDLKLENVLLKDSRSKIIKIVDFGIAGISNNINIDKINVGSLLYMAPEVLTGKVDKIGPNLDVWALGCILFGMVCGVLPFNGKN
jgi:MAP/microtubule affinity-regulating kinase